MVTDRDTNFVYLSSLIKERPGLRKFWQYLEKTLQKAGIRYDFIQNTNDLWCRDYMPVQVTKGSFIQFVFDPSYYKTKKHRHLRTDTKRIKTEVALDEKLKHSALLLDGGNLIRSRNTVVLTERVFKENKSVPKEVVLQELRQVLQVENVHLIPSLPYETSGHADGMVRLLDDNTLLVAGYHSESPSWRAKYDRAHKNTGLQLISFPGVTTDIKNEEGEFSAHGCYINFAWIGDVILFPQFDLAEDREALKEAKKIFSNHQVLPLPAADLAMSCGVLNCATWNVLV
ncbi:agmatine/peptidylarginine deiminase [Pontibacter ummariensis]|uniref:Agmatine/peptidylarginine deiminase n=1 Tax=Pontibacter ummariensis TaxID=1610492 RepID=A0A239KHG3_9BACT|nr:agmatine deiminase family protein [Pontibacter ummariensis]PRY06431.1 agmatine/peptidylarginine deiminase [Pontibacter ummariensis]SNT17118.1 Agmatine/peptidylarginine deiminase [Pontibacter ummariensis]